MKNWCFDFSLQPVRHLSVTMIYAVYVKCCHDHRYFINVRVHRVVSENQDRIHSEAAVLATFSTKK